MLYWDLKTFFSRPGGVPSVTGNILTPPRRDDSPSKIVVHLLLGNVKNKSSVSILEFEFMRQLQTFEIYHFHVKYEHEILN